MKLLIYFRYCATGLLDTFISWRCCWWKIRELKQPRRRRQQKPHNFAYLTMKNSIFTRFAPAFFIFWHFKDVLVLSKTGNDQFCSCVDDVCNVQVCLQSCVPSAGSNWFNSRMVRTHFSSIMTLKINEKWLQKLEVTFPDDVLASVDVVFA